MGEVSRIIFHQLRHELGITSGKRHIDLTSGRIFGEVTRGRQAPIEREGLRRAGLVPRLIEQIAQCPGGQGRLGGFRMREHLPERARGLPALTRGAGHVDQAHQFRG